MAEETPLEPDPVVADLVPTTVDGTETVVDPVEGSADPEPVDEALPEAAPALEEGEQAIVTEPSPVEALRLLQEGTNAELAALLQEEDNPDVANTVALAKDSLNRLYEGAVETLERDTAING